MSTPPNYNNLIQLRLATLFLNSSPYNVLATLNLSMAGYPLFQPSVVKDVMQLRYAQDVNRQLRRQIMCTNASNPLAMTYRASLLDQFLSKLIPLNTPIHIIITLKYKLSLTLDILYKQKYSAPTNLSSSDKQALLSMICQQNLIGWNLFLKGYQTESWLSIFRSLSSCIPSPQQCSWDIHLSSLTSELYKGIWHDRNASIHGLSHKES